MNKTFVRPIQVYSQGSSYRAVSREWYREVFSTLLEITPSVIHHKESWHRTFSADRKLPSLHPELSSLFSKMRADEHNVLVLELLDGDIDVHLLDELCTDLYSVIRVASTRAYSVAFVITQSELVQDSVVLQQLLVPFFNTESLALVVLPLSKTEKPTFLSSAQLRGNVSVPDLAVFKERDARQLQGSEILAFTELLSGHFTYSGSQSAFESGYHLPYVISMARLSSNREFVLQLRNDLSRELGTETFNILPIGLPGSAVDDLAIRLVESDEKRLLSPVQSGNTSTTFQKVPAVVLCDMLAPCYPLSRIVKELKDDGYRTVAVQALVKLDNDVPTDIDLARWCFALPRGASRQEQCAACSHGSPIIEADHFDGFRRQLRDFDPFSFWQILGERSNYITIGHWASDRTPNHYLFRVNVAPIIHDHGFEIAERLRNVISSRGIIQQWIHKIVIPADAEAEAVAIALARCLRLQQEDIVRISRRALKSVAGPDIPSDVQEVLHDVGAAIHRRNVIIVDQAAHHLGTLRALRSICAYYEAVVMAFAVFLDRTDWHLDEDPLLYDSHYLYLYSWPCAPRRGNECPCNGGSA